MFFTRGDHRCFVVDINTNEESIFLFWGKGTKKYSLCCRADVNASFLPKNFSHENTITDG